LVVYQKTRDDQWAIFREQLAAESRQRHEEAKAQQDSVRLALHYEIDDNLDTLGEFRARIVSNDDAKNKPSQVAARLAVVNVPVWGTVIWQGAAAVVAIALSRDEVASAYSIYKTLSDIQVTQRRLEVANSLDDAAYAAEPEFPSVVHGLPGHKFRQDFHFRTAADALVPALIERIDAVLAEGNPISSDRPKADGAQQSA
jgi:hypothetical protein